MLLSLKNGGLAIFATRTEYLEKYGYGPYMKKLEDEGRWKLIKNIKFGRYDSQKRELADSTQPRPKPSATKNYEEPFEHSQRISLNKL